MKPVIFNNIPFSLAAEEIALQLHIEPDTEDSEAFEGLVRTANEIARPKAIYTTSFITSRESDAIVLDGVRMESHVLPINLSKVHRVFPYVLTCGMEVESWASGFDDMLQVWWLDAIKIRLLGYATEHIRNHLKNDLKLGDFSSMNPGSLPDWPITEQPKLFSLLGDVKAAIGVTLTESMLMLPTKSVSGIFFQSESNFENCQLCSREGCPGRRKPFDEKSYQEMMK